MQALNWFAEKVVRGSLFFVALRIFKTYREATLFNFSDKLNHRIPKKRKRTNSMCFIFISCWYKHSTAQCLFHEITIAHKLFTIKPKLFHSHCFEFWCVCHAKCNPKIKFKLNNCCYFVESYIFFRNLNSNPFILANLYRRHNSFKYAPNVCY